VSILVHLLGSTVDAARSAAARLLVAVTGHSPSAAAAAVSAGCIPVVVQRLKLSSSDLTREAAAWVLYKLATVLPDSKAAVLAAGSVPAQAVFPRWCTAWKQEAKPLRQQLPQLWTAWHTTTWKPVQPSQQLAGLLLWSPVPAALQHQ